MMPGRASRTVVKRDQWDALIQYESKLFEQEKEEAKLRAEKKKRDLYQDLAKQVAERQKAHVKDI